MSKLLLTKLGEKKFVLFEWKANSSQTVLGRNIVFLI